MKVEVNPYRDLESNITPTEFEKFCMGVLKSYARREELRDFKISHNKKLKAHDGVYQIDVLAEFTALGVKNTVLVECKKQSRSVERDEAASLYEKLQSLGAQKGIIISTSGFQPGTTAYAKAHGIALWQICDNIINHINNCGSAESLLWQENLLKIERYLPKQFVLAWDCERDFPYEKIYPTEEEFRKAVIKKARRNGDLQIE